MKLKLIRVRVFRGGAWNDDDRLARCACRYRGMPGVRHFDVGFRCCFSPLFVIKRKIRK